MLTLEEIEAACNASQTLDFSRHDLEGPVLSLKRMFYPFGFPAEVATNSPEVLELHEQLWGTFEKQHNIEPIRSYVRVVGNDSTECPPTPSYRVMLPLMVCVADADNYVVVDLERCTAQISLSRAALRHGLYANYFILGMPGCCITTQYTTPLHAGCVAFDGSGILLCGDSGMGKSTLAYACAKAGWTYVSDDGSFLLNGGTKRLVTGDCHQMRFRPSAAELFPELQGLETTPRAAGKASIELSTASLPNISCAQTTRVDFMVFLNRAEGQPELVPYRKDVARHFMRQVPFGTPKSRTVQYAAIDRLLTAGVFELRYSDLNWAVDRLRTLVEEGR